MDFPLARSSLRAHISPSPHTADGRNVVRFAMLLTGLLVIAVPLITIGAGVPLLITVALAGVAYAVLLLYADSVFEGLCGAVFVLCTFSANFPIFELPIALVRGSPQLNLMLVDIAAVPLAILFARRLWPSLHASPSRSEKIVIYALAGLVIWSTLAAIVGNGPSRLTALFFSVMQLRYLLLFLVAAAIVRYIGVRPAIYSLLVAVGGNMAFAVAEVLNQGSFGLTYLGDAGGEALGALSTFSVGPLAFEASMYAGGYVGYSRALIAVVLLILPVTLAIIVRTQSNRWRGVAIAYLIVGAFLVRVSETDAGLGALILSVIMMFIALTYVWYTDPPDDRDLSRYLLGYLTTSIIGVLGYGLFLSRRIIGASNDVVDSSSSSGSSSSGSASSGSASSGSASNDGPATTPDKPTVQQTVTSYLDHIPLIDVVSLSIRLQQYAAAIAIAIEYPIFGIGGMNFPLVSKSYGLPAIQMHNVYLSYLASTGIPGAMLFLAAIIAILAVIIQQIIAGKNRLLFTLVICGMTGFHAINFWIAAHVVPATYMVFWTLAGAVVGVAIFDDT